MDYKLGKLPARPDAITFKMADYVDRSILPTPPADFGHDNLISQWGMLGNDQYGDCVFAGAAHETLLWNRESKKVVNFTDRAVLSDYSAVTGFNPHDPNSDRGTDMQQAAEYRRRTGVVDASGHRHKVDAYLAIRTGSVSELKIALYVFGAVGVGIQFPASAMTQFQAKQPWTPVPGSPIEGGHYIPAVAWHKDFIVVVTWGQLQKMSKEFYAKYCDEAVAYVSFERLTNGKTLEGFDKAALMTDLKALN